MRENVLKRKDYLALLVKSKNNRKRRDKLVDLADNSEVKAISEIVANALAGNLPLHSDCLAKMRRHKKKLRLISQKNYPVKRKKALIKQTGGILPALIPLGISAIAALFKTFTKK